jgi:threonyl-tRNA synthetase
MFVLKSLFSRRVPLSYRSIRVSLSDAPSVYAFEKSKNDPSLATKRHSLAHILAMAVQKIIPDAQATIGPCIENG